MFLMKYRQFLEGGLHTHTYISIPWIQKLGKMNTEYGISHKTQNIHISKIHIIIKLKLPLNSYAFNGKVMLLTYNIRALYVFMIHFV
jgi:hypothetical protein